MAIFVEMKAICAMFSVNQACGDVTDDVVMWAVWLLEAVSNRIAIGCCESNYRTKGCVGGPGHNSHHRRPRMTIVLDGKTYHTHLIMTHKQMCNTIPNYTNTSTSLKLPLLPYTGYHLKYSHSIIHTNIYTYVTHTYIPSTYHQRYSLL